MADDGPPAKKRRRGGIRQRLQESGARSAEGMHHSEDDGLLAPKRDVKTSRLVQNLLEDFAWGVQSAQKLQSTAMSSLRDLKELRHLLSSQKGEASSSSSSFVTPSSSSIEQDVEMIATIGCQGQYQNKCYSDLMARIEPNMFLPKPHTCKMRFSKGLGEKTQEILLPHMMLSAFYKCRKFWKHTILLDEDQCLQFWRAQKLGKHPQWRGHPLESMDDSALSKILPISLHGDEVPVTGIGKQWSKKMVNWSWHSMLACSSSVKQSQFFIWSMFEKAGVEEGNGGYSALRRFFQILKWSFFFLFEGVWPTRDVDGKL